MKPLTALTKSKQALQRLIPAKVIRSRLHKQTFRQFANKVGLVYFGYVDQRNDEHSLIRGLTVSTKHRDNHYCIGSYENYDVALVERVDTIHFPGKSPKTHTWIIMTFDLHHAVDLPHIFLGLHSHSEEFYAQLFTKYAHLTKINTAAAPDYDKEFAKQYAVFAKADHALAAEQLLTPVLAKTIAEQFHSLAIEIIDDTLYLYAEHAHPTTHLLDRMLTRGIWLARTLDQPAADDTSYKS